MPITEDPLQSKDAMAAFIQRARSAGYGDDDIRAIVKRKRAAYTPPPDIAAPPSNLPADVQAMQPAAEGSTMNRQLGQGSAMAIGALTGGMLGGSGTLLPMAGEMFGTYAGGRLSGVPEKEAAGSALMAGGAGLAGRGIAYGGTRLAGKMAGIKPQAVKTAIRDPSLLKQAAPDAELQLARQLESNTEIQAGKITPSHQDYQSMLAIKANDRIDATPVIEAFTNQITGADHPILRAADKQVQSMGERLLKRIGPDGKIGIGELDAYIRENFTDPLKGAYTRGSEAETVKRLMAVRSELTDKLYRAISPQAAPAQAFTQRALTKREAVENTFGMGTNAKPSSQGAEAIRGIRSNTGSAQKNRAVLQAYDAEYGTDFLGKAERLSMQREWSGDALSEAYAIDSVLQPQRPSFVRGLARPVARAGARATKYAGPTTAAAAAFYSAMNPQNNP